MPCPDDALARFERRLAQAAAAFAKALELHTLPPPQTAGCAGLGGWEGDPSAIRVEDARLRRKARRNDPTYDLNRHIAIHRLLARMGAPGR